MGSMAQVRTYFREWREYRGLTQEQVVDRLAVFEDPKIPKTKATLSRVETGKQIYTQRILEALADVYQVDEPGWLLDRNPNADGQVLDLMARLNDRQRDQAMRILETFLKDGTNN